MTKPVSPSEIVALRTTTFPPAVIDAWNTLIARKWTIGRARIDQNEAIDAIMMATNVSRQEVFDSGWLNIEEIYRAEGWKVVFDKPGYNEDYVANFTFTAKG